MSALRFQSWTQSLSQKRFVNLFDVDERLSVRTHAVGQRHPQGESASPRALRAIFAMMRQSG